MKVCVFSSFLSAIMLRNCDHLPYAHVTYLCSTHLDIDLLVLSCGPSGVVKDLLRNTFQKRQSPTDDPKRRILLPSRDLESSPQVSQFVFFITSFNLTPNTNKQNMENRWTLRDGHVVFSKEKESGGHFAAYEVPGALVADLREMFGRRGPAFGVVKGCNGYATIAKL
jgi:hypothetical protein